MRRTDEIPLNAQCGCTGWEGEPWYQHVCTVVYDEDGEYVATVYPAQGLRELPIMTVTSVVTMVNLIPSGIWR